MQLDARIRWVFAATVLGLAAASCGGDPTPTATPAAPAAEAPAATATPAAPAAEAPAATATPAAPAAEAPAPTATPVAPAAEAPAATATPAAPAPEAPAPTATPAAPAEPASFERGVGDVDGVVFVVGSGSEATFSVGEVLANVSIPDYEAVLRTTELSGEARLDGGPSLVTVDLHSMMSDNEFRDRYVRNRMFPDQPSASVEFGDLTPLPSGFADGEEVETEVTGVLRINGEEVPLTFAIEARDDGDVVYVLGRSSFTWEQINEPVPSARSVVSVEDEVRVEALLALTPQPAP